jgi:hypothetical protein
MKKFKFISEYIIEAGSEEEAKQKFADNSFNFAADAKCYPSTVRIFDKLHRAVALLKSLKKDADMALSGEWDKSDKGFEAQKEMIDKFLKEELYG